MKPMYPQKVYPLDYSMFDVRAMQQRQRSYIPNYERRVHMGAQQFRCSTPDCGINQSVRVASGAAVGMIGIGVVGSLGLGMLGMMGK